MTRYIIEIDRIGNEMQVFQVKRQTDQMGILLVEVLNEFLTYNEAYEYIRALEA